MFADLHPMLSSGVQVDRNGEIQPIKGSLGRAWLILNSSPLKHVLDSLHPLGPDSQTPTQGGGVGGELKGSNSSGGHGERRHPRKTQPVGGSGVPLCVHVRPQTPEQHRHTPSLRGGGCWGEAKERKKAEQKLRGKERQRMTGRERGGGREWEACWCHICTKPIPETIVTWPPSPDALSTSPLALSRHTTHKLSIIQAHTYHNALLSKHVI